MKTSTFTSQGFIELDGKDFLDSKRKDQKKLLLENDFWVLSR